MAGAGVHNLSEARGTGGEEGVISGAYRLEGSLLGLAMGEGVTARVCHWKGLLLEKGIIARAC